MLCEDAFGDVGKLGGFVYVDLDILGRVETFWRKDELRIMWPEWEALVMLDEHGFEVRRGYIRELKGWCEWRGWEAGASERRRCCLLQVSFAVALNGNYLTFTTAGPTLSLRPRQARYISSLQSAKTFIQLNPRQSFLDSTLTTSAPLTAYFQSCAVSHSFPHP